MLGSSALAAPRVGGRAYLVVSASGDTLLQRAADERVPIASITKLMTVLVTREHAKLGDVVTIRRQAAEVGESSAELRTGERLTVRELIEAALIQSANDAAVALAQHVGHGSVPAFVAMMNAKARASRAQAHALRQSGRPRRRRALLERARRDEAGRDRHARPLRALGRPQARGRTSPGGSCTRGTTCWRRFPGLIGVKTGHTSEAGWWEVAAARRATA